MQTKGELIFKDLLTVCFFGLIIYRWNDKSHLMYLWMALFVYHIAIQLIAHRKHFKLNNRLY